MDAMDEAVAYCLGAGIEFGDDCGCHAGTAHRDGRYVRDRDGFVEAHSLLEAWHCILGGIL